MVKQKATIKAAYERYLKAFPQAHCAMITYARWHKRGLSDQAIANRMVTPTGPQAIQYPYQGCWYTTHELALLAQAETQTMVTPAIVMNRLHRGWSARKIVTTPIQAKYGRTGVRTFRGRQYTVRELYTISIGYYHTQVTYNTFISRLRRYHWDVDRAVMTVSRNHRAAIAPELAAVFQAEANRLLRLPIGGADD